MKTKPKETSPKVIQDAEKPVETEILAEAIVNISAAFTKLLRSGLNRRAIVLLVHDASHVGKPAVSAVLDALEKLKDLYLYTRKP